MSEQPKTKVPRDIFNCSSVVQRYTPRLIIIEGCDKTGKTTLSKTLQSVYGGTYLHLGKPSPAEANDPLSWHLNHLNSVERPQKTDPLVIMDRFHLSNLVYGKVSRHKHLNREEFFDLETELLDWYPVIVYCWRETDKLLDSWHAEEMYTFNVGQRVINLYELALRETRLPVMRFNMDQEEFSINKLGELCTLGSITESTAA